MPLFRELRRRRVLRTLGLYVVAAWVAVQVASLLLPAFSIEEEALLYVWLIAGALLPLVLVFSWFYDVSADGITRTPPASADDAFDSSLRRADVAIIAALVGIGLVVTTQFGLRIDSNTALEPSTDIDPFSIAVMPLDDMSGNADEQFFVAGMQSALIDGLSRVRRLRVTAKVSTLPYAETGGSLQSIAEDLRVARIIEGTVLRAGDRVRISLRLHDAARDEQVWAQTFEDDLESILLLQARVAQEVANQVRAELTPEERQVFAAARPVEPAAYLAYLRGVFHVERFTAEDMQIAAGHFQRAVELDPESALGHWGLGKLCVFQAQSGLLSPAAAKEQCLRPIYRALDLDPLLPEAHLGLATFTTWQLFDWASAREHWERALALNPSFAEAHMFYSHYLGIVGELEKSTYHMGQAVALDPLNPFVAGLHSMQFVMLDDFDAAISRAEDAIAMAPGNAFPYTTLYVAHDALGNEDEAIAANVTLLRTVGGQPELAATLEAVFEERGYAAANLTVADKMSAAAAETYVKPIVVGSFFEAAGQFETAIDWYERAYEERDPDAPYLGVNAKRPEIRTNPRFQALLVRMGLGVWNDRR